MEPCPHDVFESQVFVERREGYVIIHVRSRCAAPTCQARVVFEGHPVAVEQQYYTTSVSQRGTEILLVGKMARLVVEEEAAPWVRTEVVLPPPPVAEP